MGPIDNNTVLVQIMAWHRTGDKPLSEPMTALAGEWWHIYASLGLNELNCPQMNASCPHSWWITIGSSEDFVSPDKKPLPEQIQTQVLWRHLALQGANELMSHEPNGTNLCPVENDEFSER